LSQQFLTVVRRVSGEFIFIQDSSTRVGCVRQSTFLPVSSPDVHHL